MCDNEIDSLKDLIELTEMLLEKESPSCLNGFREAGNKKMESENRRYVFLQNEETDEIHICIAERNGLSPKFSVEREPICGQVAGVSVPRIVRKENTYSGEEARCIAAAGQNKKYEFCGTCVSHLYHTDNKK